MINAEPYFYDPTSQFTGWKKDGVWHVANGRIWAMDRDTVIWRAAIPEMVERFEALCVSV